MQMKVLHINCNYLTTALHQTMVNQLTDLGVQSVVFAPTYDTKMAIIRPNENVIVSQCFDKWDRVLYAYKQKKIIAAVEHTVDVSSFDVLHAYTLFTDGNVALTMKRRYGVPYVVAIRDTDVNAFLRYRVHLRARGLEIMRNASAVFFLSPAYKQLVFEKYIPERYRAELENKVYIVPNGIDDFWFQNRNDDCARSEKPDEDPLRLIFVGQLSKRKNVTTTLKAIDLLISRGKKIAFTAIGKIVDKDVHEELCKKPYATYIPPQPKEKLAEQYRGNDIFVMPSKTETFGLVYAEAISQGLPVIYSKGQGFDGQFTEGMVGYAVACTSPESVAEGICRVLDNYETIQQNCARCADKFGWKTICEKYLGLYRQIADHRAAHREE